MRIVLRVRPSGSCAVQPGRTGAARLRFALVFIDDSDLRTLPIGRLPMVLLFLAGQRQFIRGLGEGYGK